MRILRLVSVVMLISIFCSCIFTTNIQKAHLLKEGGKSFAVNGSRAFTEDSNGAVTTMGLKYVYGHSENYNSSFKYQRIALEEEHGLNYIEYGAKWNIASKDESYAFSFYLPLSLYFFEFDSIALLTIFNVNPSILYSVNLNESTFLNCELGFSPPLGDFRSSVYTAGLGLTYKLNNGVEIMPSINAFANKDLDGYAFNGGFTLSFYID